MDIRAAHQRAENADRQLAMAVVRNEADDILAGLVAEVWAADRAYCRALDQAGVATFAEATAAAIAALLLPGPDGSTQEPCGDCKATAGQPCAVSCIADQGTGR